MPETQNTGEIEEDILDSGLDSRLLAYVSGIRHPHLVKMRTGQVKPSSFHLARLSRVLRSVYDEAAFTSHRIPEPVSERVTKGSLPDGTDVLKLVPATDVRESDMIAYSPSSKRVGGHNWVRVIGDPERKGSQVNISIEGEKCTLNVMVGVEHPVMVARPNQDSC